LAGRLVPDSAEAKKLFASLPSSLYRLYSRSRNPKTGKRRDLGTFRMRTEALQHERAIQYFKRH